MSVQHDLLIQTRLHPHKLADVLAEKLPFAIKVTSNEDLERIGLNWKTVVTQNEALNFTVAVPLDYQQEFSPGYSGDTILNYQGTSIDSV